LCINTGLAVSVHYCGGKFSSFSAINAKKKSCACGKKKMPKTCCKDTKTTLSTDDNQQVPKIGFAFPDFTPLTALLPSQIFLPETSHLILDKKNNNFHASDSGPPKMPIYIRVCSFLI
jgi:hypothetical protein